MACRRVQAASQQQIQQLQAQNQAIQGQQADILGSMRHVGKQAMQKLSVKHDRQMAQMRSELQQEDSLREQITRCLLWSVSELHLLWAAACLSQAMLAKHDGPDAQQAAAGRLLLAYREGKRHAAHVRPFAAWAAPMTLPSANP